jgi:hypothetical protein
MTKVAIYARYSSDSQREASIEDQFRLCREYAKRQGWQLVESYSDQAISGASLLRPGIQRLLADAQSKRFNVILAESLDRISRDQEDIAGVYKRMSGAFAMRRSPRRRPHPTRQTTSPAPASGGGSLPSCSSAPAAANAPGSLMLFQVVSIQPSERWPWEMRNSSIWPLKGSAMAVTCPASR